MNRGCVRLCRLCMGAGLAVAAVYAVPGARAPNRVLPRAGQDTEGRARHVRARAGEAEGSVVVLLAFSRWLRAR